MPQAKRASSTSRSRASSTSRSRASFKQPPALKRFNTSLDGAQKALGELSKSSGRDLSKGAKDIYADLRKFVSNARRDSGKLGKALQRDFEQAQKKLATATSSKSSGRSSASRSTSSRSTRTRSSSSRSASGRSTSKRATSTRSGSSRRGSRKS